jgi:hypothetical protein
VGLRQFVLQRLVLGGHLGVPDEVIPEQQPVPMLEMRLNHVDVVRPDPTGVPLDEPGVERRAVAEGGSPEVVVSLGLQHGDDNRLRTPEACHLHEHVHDGLRRQVRDRRAAEMLDPPDQVARQAGAQVILLPLKEFDPSWVVTALSATPVAIL